MKLFHPYFLLILLSLTKTSKAVVQYARAGCNDMCGSVRIPFPFGIGENCAVNDWYIVNCNSSTPYLSALHLEVLRVDLKNQTVTVNTPIISDCSNRSDQIMSIDLDKSPFLFSKSNNKFVVVGCGSALMMDHAGNALTGCSTDCHNDTVSEKNNGCLGIGCCQITIPHHIKSYTLNITRLERRGTDGGCGSAFLVDKNSYNERRVSDHNSLIPISLLWTLDHYSDLVSCCGYPRRLNVDVGNGSVDSWRCVSLYYYDESPDSIEENP